MSDPLEIKITVSVDENCNLREDWKNICPAIGNDLYCKSEFMASVSVCCEK